MLAMLCLTYRMAEESRRRNLTCFTCAGTVKQVDEIIDIIVAQPAASHT